MTNCALCFFVALFPSLSLFPLFPFSPFPFSLFPFSIPMMSRTGVVAKLLILLLSIVIFK